jgi:UDP-N-acetylmuramoyl-tripeptide--D-alanyl-D-alanine ligase
MQDLVKLWVGPIPPEHIWISAANRPHSLPKLFRVYFRKWLVHPIKRRAAKYYLEFLRLFGLKVIGITGSAGKTTTTEMLKSILSLHAPTVASRINIDPIYNIPTTILSCTPKTKFLVLEMGIEYLGEMDYYTWLAKPDIGIITNVNLTHTEFLKDIKTIAQEKGKIGHYAKHLIISDDKNIHPHTHGQIHVVKPGNFKLQLLGNHLQTNATLASKAAQLLGVPDSTIKTGLENLQAPEHRLQLIKTAKYTLIDDTYNANLVAVKASIDTLVDYAKANKKTPVMVFGQMNELGNFEESAHKEIDQYIKKNGIKYVFTLGPATKNIGQHFESQDEIYDALKKFLNPKYVILIKASRGWKMENLVTRITSSA